ncbi:hypothetical protein BLNAU_11829 [Blattamonas nauphoetae]|uniref:Uncharacterized protein n=1 Tax=Blattamonas nauphoetae TaxID=2049346 RepID=A0ABQ9XNU7_9EUKA|nr:hypothetical protein BLNAU_11829 [Blattamonas nauphoetae]
MGGGMDHFVCLRSYFQLVQILGCGGDCLVGMAERLETVQGSVGGMDEHLFALLDLLGDVKDDTSHVAKALFCFHRLTKSVASGGLERIASVSSGTVLWRMEMNAFCLTSHCEWGIQAREEEYFHGNSEEG